MRGGALPEQSTRALTQGAAQHLRRREDVVDFARLAIRSGRRDPYRLGGGHFGRLGPHAHDGWEALEPILRPFDHLDVGQQIGQYHAGVEGVDADTARATLFGLLGERHGK